MAGVTLDLLPPALGLNGTELIWVYQQGPTSATPWIGVQCTTGQLAGYVMGGPQIGYVSTTMRQLLGAMQQQGVLTEAIQALPSDVTNIYNIAWTHATNITIGDIFITGFLQPTLGYTNTQMSTLFALASTVPQYSAGTATMRQLIAAMASQSTLTSVIQALPSDTTNTYNIAWDHANFMPLTDTFITGFLQPALGYSSGQMSTLYTYSLTFPA